MRSDNLQSIAKKIKALLAKTQAAGCTESEALEAAAKAQELLQTYQLDMSELEIQEEGAAYATQKSDPRAAPAGIAKAVGGYCDCLVTRASNQKSVNFLGLRSDVDLATWLLASMETFVASEAIGWMFEQDGEATPAHMESFVIGAYKRIAERLRAETAKRKGEAGPQANALVVLKNQLITQHPMFAEYQQAGHMNWRGGITHAEAARAGAAAGNGASFGRPIRASNAGLIERQGGTK